MLVRLHDSINSIDFWVKDISIQGETVISCVSIWWDSCAKTENRDLFVAIIVLQYVAHGLDSVQVLILVHVQQVVERTRLGRCTIRQSKINCYSQADFTTTKYVFEERVAKLYL